MLIILLDEPGLFVFSGVEESVAEIEPWDAEHEIRAVFDGDGVPYRTEWIRPNRSGGRLVQVIEHGEYTFVPAGPPDVSGLRRLLVDHPLVANPEHDAHAALLALRDAQAAA